MNQKILLKNKFVIWWVQCRKGVLYLFFARMQVKGIFHTRLKVYQVLILLNRKGLFSNGRKKEQLEVFEESEIQREC